MSTDGRDEETKGEEVEGDGRSDVPALQDEALAQGATQLQEVKAKPSAELIEHLERLLEYAKTGELQAMTSICSWTEKGISTGWCIPDINETKYHLVELDRLKLKLLLADPAWREEFAEMIES